ncbi:hypothetical protein L798_06265 [Zootermopsis nevadensis]|uniref:Uncharacterized protein n=1 Tax=Zootermopsis nevadensis TaxID=136037 RepID=A0A067R720_ZOONE|nr:hypothetical protein L798_06265 [Zootermopsis nevadensis]
MQEDVSKLLLATYVSPFQLQDGCLLDGKAVNQVEIYHLFKCPWANIIRDMRAMMEASRTSETSAKLYQTTRRYNLEDTIFVLTAHSNYSWKMYSGLEALKEVDVFHSFYSS